jgi:hypothetical protein
MAAEALGAIARKALDRKTGARGLRSIMDAILLDSTFDLPSLEDVKEIVISQQVVEAPQDRSTCISVARGRSKGVYGSRIEVGPTHLLVTNCTARRPVVRRKEPNGDNIL